MNISDALARKLATYVVLTKRVEDRAIERIAEAIDRLWEEYKRRAKRFGEAAPLDILLYEFRVRWQPAKRVAEFYDWLVRMLEELGRGAVLVTVDEILRHRPDLRGAVDAAAAEVFRLYGRPGEHMFTGTAGGYTLDETLRRFFERLGLAVEDSIRTAWGQSFHEALMAGLTPGQAAQEAFRAVGIDWRTVEDRIRRNTWQVERIVRTHSMAAVNMVQHLFCRALADQGLVVGERWVATPDMLTCPECATLDGQTWYFEGEPNVRDRPSLPRHPNCRCTIVPVLAPQYDPEPIKVFTYEDWFSGLSEEKQRAILGDLAYQAWKAGLPLREALLGRLTVTDVMSAADVAQVVAEALTAEVPPGPRFGELWGEAEIRVVEDLPSEQKQFELELATVITNYYKQLTEVWPTLPTDLPPFKCRLKITSWRLGDYNGFYDSKTRLITLDLGSIVDCTGDYLWYKDRQERINAELPVKDAHNAIYRDEMADPRLYAAYVVRHELGHHLDLMFAEALWVLGKPPSEVYDAYAKVVREEPTRIIKAHATVRSLFLNTKWVEENIGKYATRSEAELFAETVALYTSPFYDRRLPREVEESLDILLGGRARVEYIRAVTAKLAALPMDLTLVKEYYI